MEYLNRPWATIAVDLGQATEDAETDVVPPLDLRDLELATEHAVPCLAIHEQIAQKMHALTEPAPRGQPNPRARDVLDVLLLIERLAVELNAVRVACERVFTERAMHPWPIYVFTFPPAWPAILAGLAREIGYNTDDASIIQSRFNDLLAHLNGAPALPTYEYQFAILDFVRANDPQGDTFAAPIKQDDGNARWQHLDALTKGGWRVHSMQEYRRQSAGQPELLVLLERERQEAL